MSVLFLMSRCSAVESQNDRVLLPAPETYDDKTTVPRQVKRLSVCVKSILIYLNMEFELKIIDSEETKACNRKERLGLEEYV